MSLSLSDIQEGDLIWLESPKNCTGELVDLTEFARRCRHKRAWCVVDGTLAPAPLINALQFGVHMVMHSTTKFYGGHSDLLGGVLVTSDENNAHQVHL
jgi:cystathionine gamma-synthase